MVEKGKKSNEGQEKCLMAEVKSELLDELSLANGNHQIGKEDKATIHDDSTRKCPHSWG